jgi:hypothetical protein
MCEKGERGVIKERRGRERLKRGEREKEKVSGKKK